MQMNVEIRNTKYLYRAVENLNSQVEKLIACVFLIAFEFRSAEKIQFNLISENGSIHFEYKPKMITYYIRNSFSYNSSCNMSVSIIQSIGFAYTSRVTGKDSFDCFSEYLKMSDQRDATLEFHHKSIIKVEKLPPSRNKGKSTFLESVRIDVHDITYND